MCALTCREAAEKLSGLKDAARSLGVSDDIDAFMTLAFVSLPVIPKDNPNKITIDRKGLMSVLRRVLPFASDSSQLIRLHLEPGKLELSSKDLDFSTSAKENIVCEYTGQIMDIGFKGGSLTEILGNINSDEIIIELADPSRAGIIVPSTQPENEEVLMLIMPMLLND